MALRRLDGSNIKQFLIGQRSDWSDSKMFSRLTKELWREKQCYCSLCARLITYSFMVDLSVSILLQSGLLSQLKQLMSSADSDGHYISQAVKCILYESCSQNVSDWRISLEAFTQSNQCVAELWCFSTTNRRTKTPDCWEATRKCSSGSLLKENGFFCVWGSACHYLTYLTYYINIFIYLKLQEDSCGLTFPETQHTVLKVDPFILHSQDQQLKSKQISESGGQRCIVGKHGELQMIDSHLFCLLNTT